MNQKINARCITFKTVVPHDLISIIEDISIRAAVCVKEMLEDRSKTSSKHYTDRIPCVVAKSLVSKYQKNKKCQSVKNLVLPICGDKGKQIKIENGGLRIPALFKKRIIPVTFPKPVVGFIRQVEFFKKDSKWFMSYAYNTPCLKEEYNGVVGVDRNSVGNVATLGDPQTGRVLRLGPDTNGLKKNFRNRRRKLQKKGAKHALVKIRKNQDRRTKDINHKVSRSIVDYAHLNRRAIILEDLGNIRKGKAKRYVEKSQWSFFQLETFIKYKASLLGVPIFYINPKNTSKECSRCGKINNPIGKAFKCSCGHFDHRDANAAFNIAKRFLDQTISNQKPIVGLIGNPLTGGSSCP